MSFDAMQGTEASGFDLTFLLLYVWKRGGQN